MLTNLETVHFKKLILSSIPWYENSRIGVNMIGKLLPSLCAIAKVPRLTNHSIRTSSIRAMRRGGFDLGDVAFVSGHKNLKNLSNYDSLTDLDKTKIALAMQHGPATLDGDQIDLDALARGKKRKVNEALGEGTSKGQNDVAQEKVFHIVVDCNDDSGFGGSEASSIPPSPAISYPKIATVTSNNNLAAAVTSNNDPAAAVIVGNPEDAAPEVVLSQTDYNGMPQFILSDNHANPEPANSQPDPLERAIPSSQAHNVAQLIRDHMSSSKELINNYLSAMKKKN